MARGFDRRDLPRWSTIASTFPVIFFLGICWPSGASALFHDRKDDRDDTDLIQKGADAYRFLDELGERRRGPEILGACVQVRVQDNVGRPVDGRVTLRRADGASHSVTTTASRGTLCAVAPGRYTVTLDPKRNLAPPPRTIEIRSRSDRPLLTLATGPPREDPREPRPGVSAPDPPRPTSRWLGSGRTLVAQGSVMDSVGRPADALIRVYRGPTEVGHVSSTAGRFSMHDLERGEYTAVARSARDGRETSRSFSIGIGISRMVVRVP